MHKYSELQYPLSDFFPFDDSLSSSPFSSDDFGLKSILLDVTMVTLVCFLHAFALNNFSVLLPEVIAILYVKVYFLNANERWVLFLHPLS